MKTTLRVPDWRQAFQREALARTAIIRANIGRILFNLSRIEILTEGNGQIGVGVRGRIQRDQPVDGVGQEHPRILVNQGRRGAGGPGDKIVEALLQQAILHRPLMTRAPAQSSLGRRDHYADGVAATRHSGSGPKSSGLQPRLRAAAKM